MYISSIILLWCPGWVIKNNPRTRQLYRAQIIIWKYNMKLLTLWVHAIKYEWQQWLFDQFSKTYQWKMHSWPEAWSSKGMFAYSYEQASRYKAICQYLSTYFQHVQSCLLRRSCKFLLTLTFLSNSFPLFLSSISYFFGLVFEFLCLCPIRWEKSL